MSISDVDQYVTDENARAFASECPKCGAKPGDWCVASTMHYERWGYGSLSETRKPEDTFGVGLGWSS